MPEHINRRTFLDLAAAGAAGFAVATAARAQDTGLASNRVIVGVMGLSRGAAVANTFANQPNVEVRYVIERVCTAAADGKAPTIATCDLLPPKVSPAGTDNEPKRPPLPSIPHYRRLSARDQ